MKKILVLLIAIFALTVFGCNKNNEAQQESEQTADAKDSASNQDESKKEAAKADDGAKADDAAKPDGVDVSSNAKLIAEVMSIDLNKMGIDYFAVDGEAFAPKYNLSFFLKEAPSPDVRKQTLTKLNDYLKSAAADHKIYADKALSNEWTEDQMYENADGELVFLKLGDNNYKLQIIQENTNHVYKDKQFPVWAFRIEKF